jgi:hypothetical protein
MNHCHPPASIPFALAIFDQTRSWAITAQAPPFCAEK